MKSAKLNMVCTLAVILSALSLPAIAQEKIAIINLRKVFDGYYKTKLATDDLKKQGVDLDKEMAAMTSQRQKAAEDYKVAVEEANNMAVSATEREKRKRIAEEKLREIQNLEQSMKQFQTQASTTMQEKERRMRENVIGEIRAVISTKAKIAGFGLVLDVTGESLSRIPMVVYHSGQTDMTEEVLKELNANAPAGSFPAPANK